MDTIMLQHEKMGLFVNMIAIVIIYKNTMFNLELWPWTDSGHLIILDMCYLLITSGVQNI